MHATSCRCLAKGSGDKPILLPHIIQDELCAVCEECCNPALRSGELSAMLKTVQEAVVIAPRIAFALRPTMGEWYHIRINVEDMSVEEISASHYLAFKEKLVPADASELLGTVKDADRGGQHSGLRLRPCPAL